MRPVDGTGGTDRHPLDPAVGDVYGPTCGVRRDFFSCVDDPSELAEPHCHCVSHTDIAGTWSECEWGKKEFIRRLIQALEELLHARSEA